MARWADVEREAPELAATAQRFLDARVHKVLATLRADGTPRVSGIEARIEDGELWFGSMPGALKGRDLRRDPRCALHSGSEDPPGWRGDAKLTGRAVPAGQVGGGERFNLDIEELAVVRLNDARDGLIIEFWRAGRGVRRVERA